MNQFAAVYFLLALVCFIRWQAIKTLDEVIK